MSDGTVDEQIIENLMAVFLSDANSNLPHNHIHQEFENFARTINQYTCYCDYKRIGLQKLLEAKDWFIRAEQFSFINSDQ